MASEHGDYFDFNNLSADRSVFGTDRSRKTWLGYEPESDYQYRPLLPHTSWKELVDLCVSASACAIAYTSAAG